MSLTHFASQPSILNTFQQPAKRIAYINVEAPVKDPQTIFHSPFKNGKRNNDYHNPTLVSSNIFYGDVSPYTRPQNQQQQQNTANTTNSASKYQLEFKHSQIKSNQIRASAKSKDNINQSTISSQSTATTTSQSIKKFDYSPSSTLPARSITPRLKRQFDSSHEHIKDHFAQGLVIPAEQKRNLKRYLHAAGSSSNIVQYVVNEQSTSTNNHSYASPMKQNDNENLKTNNTNSESKIIKETMQQPQVKYMSTRSSSTISVKQQEYSEKSNKQNSQNGKNTSRGIWQREELNNGMNWNHLTNGRNTQVNPQKLDFTHVPLTERQNRVKKEEDGSTSARSNKAEYCSSSYNSNYKSSSQNRRNSNSSYSSATQSNRGDNDGNFVRTVPHSKPKQLQDQQQSNYQSNKQANQFEKYASSRSGSLLHREICNCCVNKQIVKENRARKESERSIDRNFASATNQQLEKEFQSQREYAEQSRRDASKQYASYAAELRSKERKEKQQRIEEKSQSSRAIHAQVEEENLAKLEKAKSDKIKNIKEYAEMLRSQITHKRTCDEFNQKRFDEAHPSAQSYPEFTKSKPTMRNEELKKHYKKELNNQIELNDRRKSAHKHESIEKDTRTIQETLRQIQEDQQQGLNAKNQRKQEYNQFMVERHAQELAEKEQAEHARKIERERVDHLEREDFAKKLAKLNFAEKTKQIMADQLLKQMASRAASEQEKQPVSSVVATGLAIGDNNDPRYGYSSCTDCHSKTQKKQLSNYPR